jgi:hypothetical protein
MTYTLQVSDHAGAGDRIPTSQALESWRTVYDGPIATEEEARKAVDGLAQWHRHARAFRGQAVGKLWYANLRVAS